ncbi:hypothetical protein GW17_00052747 [Ensete ventricosum]|nr:hypothetical protein GW17_00052747 [Ensete ventricosum]
MTGFGSPCGACKFLRRKCVRGCVFAPYFCYEQGAAHFAAIHKVFGASNASKLLLQLLVSDRPEAALTISYEAPARLQDPVYGCVSHIFALQQQVSNSTSNCRRFLFDTNRDPLSASSRRHESPTHVVPPRRGSVFSTVSPSPLLIHYRRQLSCAMASSLDVQDDAWSPACHDMEELL